MVKLRGPMMSLAASGSLGKKLTFGKALGRAYARRLVKPSNPQTPPQISARAMLTFLSQQWTLIFPSAKATWQPRADAEAIAPYHAYCQYNAARWRTFKAPMQPAPPRPDVPASGLATWSAVAGVREITLSLTSDLAQTADWGFLIFSSTSPGFTPAYGNLIAAVRTNGATVVNFVHGPLQPGTYYYDAKLFTTLGSAGALKGEINATIS